MIEVNNRKSVTDDLNNYTYSNDKGAFIEVTQWASGEGWDININDQKYISLHFGELEAINYLTKYLEYGSDADSKNKDE